MDALVRPHRSEDLGQVVGLWESAGEAWPGLDVSMRLLLDAGAVCVVAETHGRVVGCGLGVVAGGVGWIWRTDAASSDISAGSGRTLGMRKVYVDPWYMDYTIGLVA